MIERLADATESILKNLNQPFQSNLIQTNLAGPATAVPKGSIQLADKTEGVERLSTTQSMSFLHENATQNVTNVNREGFNRNDALAYTKQATSDSEFFKRPKNSTKLVSHLGIGRQDASISLSQAKVPSNAAKIQGQKREKSLQVDKVEASNLQQKQRLGAVLDSVLDSGGKQLAHPIQTPSSTKSSAAFSHSRTSAQLETFTDRKQFHEDTMTSPTGMQAAAQRLAMSGSFFSSSKGSFGKFQGSGNFVNADEEQRLLTLRQAEWLRWAKLNTTEDTPDRRAAVPFSASIGKGMWPGGAEAPLTPPSNTQVYSKQMGPW